MAPRPFLVALLGLSALLSGCAGGGGGASPDEGDGGPGGRDGDGPEGGPPAMEAPDWDLGDHWDHHWYIPDGAGGEFDFPVKVIVTQESQAGWMLSAGDLQSALFHAAFFFPDLGLMGADFTSRAAGFAYPWYDFPLSDNKTWTAQESNLDLDLEPVQRSLQFRSTWVGRDGAVPGHYLIEAREGESLRARYDYRPDLGWFGEYFAYDSQAGPDPANYTFRVVAERAGDGYAGAYFDAVAEPLLAHVNFFSPASPAPPDPAASFTMSPGMTHLLALEFSFAAGGFHDTELVAPDGARHGFQAFEANGQSLSEGEDTLILPAQEGEWRVATVGAGAFAAGGGVLAWGATVTEGAL